MIDEASKAGTCIDLECERWLRQYEKMTCVVCGEPLKIYLAHYPRKMHVRCLLKKSKNAVSDKE